VSFSGGVVVGYKDGSAWGGDEYGRSPGHPEYRDKIQFDREWASAQKAKRAWALKREGRSLARDHDDHNHVGDEIMREELAKYHADRVKRKTLKIRDLRARGIHPM
jgi:hypothetical protein